MNISNRWTIQTNLPKWILLKWTTRLNGENVLNASFTVRDDLIKHQRITWGPGPMGFDKGPLTNFIRPSPLRQPAGPRADVILSGRGRSDASNVGLIVRLTVRWLVTATHSRSVPRRITTVFNHFGVIGLKAKFHYTDPRGLCRRPARTQRSFSETRAVKKSVRVRSGPVGPV